ncbi:MAG: enoyl-CoA hydratase/isomerase [Gammaproteobacteria bacterium]
MDRLNTAAAWSSVQVRADGEVCYLRLHRPHANNTIDDTLVAECAAVLDECSGWAKIVVLEGQSEVFCFGADLKQFNGARTQRDRVDAGAQALYDLWLRFKRGPFVSIAHVRGKANAGGVGFAAACDLVLCDEAATFSLSELLFGLVPACVLPFLIDRVGRARAHALTLMTQPLCARQALEWGLADGCAENSDLLLRNHLRRLRLLPRDGIARYKRYIGTLDGFLEQSRPAAVACNVEAFSDPVNLGRIERYASTGKFPWEGGP